MTGSNYFFRGLIATLLLLTATTGYAQVDLGITLNINPPYTTNITDYSEIPGKINLMVRNNTNAAKGFYLRVAITGDNGITLFSDPNSKPANRMTLQPFGVTAVSNSDLQDIFSASRYKLTGITATDVLKKNGVPEGIYNICVRAYDYNTNLPLSNDAPQGCKMVMLANLEPPILIKPLIDEEVISAEPQNMVFTWTLPAGAEPGTGYKLRIVELINAARNINDAYNTAPAPAFFETIVYGNVFVYGPAQPKLVPRRRYVWAVTAIPGRSQIAYKNGGVSEVHAFTYKIPDPPKPVVTLVYPDDQASLPPSGGAALDPNNFSLKWDFTNPLLKSYVQEAFVYEVLAGQSPADAVKNNPRVNSDKEPNKKTAFICGCNPDGKTYAWMVRIAEGGNLYYSPIQTFSVQKSNAADQKFTTFDFAGFPATVQFVNEKGQYVYSGSAAIAMYQDGPYTNVKFDNLVIKPFSYTVKSVSRGGLPPQTDTTFTDWRAVLGSGTVSVPSKFNIPFTVPNGIGSVINQKSKTGLSFQFTGLTLNANLKTGYDFTKKIFTVVDQLPSHGATATGSFLWESTMPYLDANGDAQIAEFTASVSTPYNYYTTFTDSTGFIMHCQSPNVDGSMTLPVSNNSTLMLTPTLYLKYAGRSGMVAKFNFGGYYTIPKQKNGYMGLTVIFSKKESMQFNQDISKYVVSLSKDNKVIASFGNVNVDLMDVKLTIPQLNVAFTKDNKTYNFGYTKAFFDPFDGLYCKETSVASNELNVSGFPVKITSSTIQMSQCKLTSLDLKGSLTVPFVKLAGNVVINATENGVQQVDVSLDMASTATLYQNAGGDKCTISNMSGSILDDRIVMSGELKFSNISYPDSNFNLPRVGSPDFFIMPNGDVGIQNAGPDGAAATYADPGSYNGFKFVPSNINFVKTADKTYQLKLNGWVVVADNLSSNTKAPNFSTSVGFTSPDAPAGGNQPANSNVGFTSSDVSVGRHDNTVDFGVSMTYYSNDPVYGKGFKTVADFNVQQPNPMTMHATMIVAKAPGGFNYWYFDGSFHTDKAIPTGLLDVGVYGFTGRVYYKVAHSGPDINNANYVPDGSKFIGIYGKADLKTMEDNGIKFWGGLAMEISTTSGGLDKIQFRGDAQFLAMTGVGSDGLMSSKDCELNFSWSPKALWGNFNVTGNFYSAFSVNVDASLNFDKSSFEVGGFGSAYLFGNSLFGCGHFGLDFTNTSIEASGTFGLTDIHKDFDFKLCDPSVSVTSNMYVDAKISWVPSFFFKGQCTFHNSIEVAGCRLRGKFGLDLDSQIEFPNPTCISVSIPISTPLKDFTLSAGFKDGSLMFDSCF